jgi:hypothetical protein
MSLEYEPASEPLQISLSGYHFQPADWCVTKLNKPDVCKLTCTTSMLNNREVRLATRWTLGASLPPSFEGHVTKFSLHQALKSIAWGKLT